MLLCILKILKTAWLLFHHWTKLKLNIFLFVINIWGTLNSCYPLPKLASMWISIIHFQQKLGLKNWEGAKRDRVCVREKDGEREKEGET